MQNGARSGPSARTRMAEPACATSFPCSEAGGLLFVFMVPGADGLLQSLQHAPPHIITALSTVCAIDPSPAVLRGYMHVAIGVSWGVVTDQDTFWCM